MKYKLLVAQTKIKGLKGRGLFAGQNIPKGKKIIEYTGEKISFKEYKRREKFYDSIGYCSIFWIDNKNIIDGLVGGNESLMANHSRKSPNIESVGKYKIWFKTLRDIKKGEELCLDYGDEFTDSGKLKI